MANIKISELPITHSLDSQASFLVQNVVGGEKVTQQIPKADFESSVV